MSAPWWPWLIVAALSAACEPQLPPQDLTVRLGMTATELNAQPAMRAASQAAEANDSDWFGLNGPLDLHVRLNDRMLDVPVAAQGGVQFTTTMGPDLNFPEARLNSITADVRPKPVTLERARAIAQQLCEQARQAGLTRDAGPPEPSRVAARWNDFVSICWLQDENQAIQVQVAPARLTPSDDYRVLLTVGARWEDS